MAARTSAVTLPNSAELIALLPHRPPFRFIDAVDHCDPGAAVIARWQIEGDEPWLAGHFPGNPVVPGVLQLEALAQAGAIAVLATPEYAGRLPLFGGVEDVRFRRQVTPGAEIVLTVEIERLSGRGGWGRGTATVRSRDRPGPLAVSAHLNRTRRTAPDGPQPVQDQPDPATLKLLFARRVETCRLRAMEHDSRKRPLQQPPNALEERHR